MIADFTGRKVRTAPREYGFSTYIEITDDDRVRPARAGRRRAHELSRRHQARLQGGLARREPIPPRGQPAGQPLAPPRRRRGVNLPALVYSNLVSPGSVRPGTRRARARRTVDVGPPGPPSRARGGRLSPRLRWLREFLSADVVEDLFWRDPLPGVAEQVGRLRKRSSRARSSHTPASPPTRRSDASRPDGFTAPHRSPDRALSFDRTSVVGDP